MSVVRHGYQPLIVLLEFIGRNFNIKTAPGLGLYCPRLAMQPLDGNICQCVG